MNKKAKGQSLLEVLIALAVAVIVVLALVRAVTVAIRNASFARSQASATKYAQEGMEWIRSQRDERWTNLLNQANDSTYCLNTLSWASGGCSFSLGGKFKREATVKPPVGDKIEVEVKVSWQETDRTHKSQLYSYFTKW